MLHRWSVPLRFARATLVSVALLAGAPIGAAAAPMPAFDLDAGNAPFEVVIPTVIPVILADVSPGASDPSLIFRITALVTTSWFDAIAPYHETAVGVYSRFPVRLEDPSNRQRNTAILYASRHVLNSLFPSRAADWDRMLADVGLDPNDASEDPSTGVGIGNLAGKAVVSARLHDGMNQIGDEGGRRYHREPYADYTGYRPVNSAYAVSDRSRWQPNLVSRHNGLFHVQQFVTPQLGRTEAFTYDDPVAFRAPPPVRSHAKKDKRGYQAQAEEVLAVSAGLDDAQKMAAELFDQKFNSVFGAVAFTVMSTGMDLEQAVHVEFLTNVASFDTAIAVWNDKAFYDAVRPFTAIHELFGDRPVRAWGGPGRGTVEDLPGREWQSYLPVANHPEYPSASAAFCGAHAEVMARLTGTDTLNYSVTFPKGSSVIEPGVTPAQDVTLTFATWSELSTTCGLSRLWGGVHFRDALGAGEKIGRTVGANAYDYYRAHVDGTAKPTE